jgi:hypothetical protein
MASTCGRRRAFDQRPPGVDVAAHVRQAALVVVQVAADRTAAAGVVGHQRLDAGGVEHARGGRVDVGHHRRLHATQQHQHLARVFARRPLVCARAPRRRHLGQRAGSSGRTSWPSFMAGANSGEVRPP